MPFWHEAHYIFLRTSHFLLLSSSSPMSHQPIMDTPPPQPCGEGSDASRSTGASSNTSLLRTQQEHRHLLVHCKAANVATKNITQDAHFKIVHKTRSSMNTKQHAIGCEYFYTMVNGRQLTVSWTAGVRRERHGQFIAARNRKPPWSTNTFVYIVCETGTHDVVSSGIFAHELRDKHPRERTKQASITLE